MQRILFLILLSAVVFKPVVSQVASCVHGQGISYLLDALGGAFGACNCQKAGTFLLEMPSCSTDFELVFEDNFDGNSLDSSKWEIQPWGQGALQGDGIVGYYSLDNISISGGTCKIIAKQETVVRRAVSYYSDSKILSDGLPNLRTYSYTSSNIWTRSKFFFGKYEISAKLPDGKGFWPAFWTYGGTRWNEIDIFDNYAGTKTLVTGVGHDYDGNGTGEGCSDSQSGFDFTQWHTFTCIFDFDKITWKVDGNTVRVLRRFETVSGIPVECGEDIAIGSYFIQKSWPLESMSIILNLALGSGNGSAPAVGASTPFPGTFEIGYVRMWKRVDCCNVNIYPNPATDQVTITSNLTSPATIILYDLTGRLVLGGVITQGAGTISVSKLRQGLYFYRLISDGMVVGQGKLLIF